MNIVALSGKLGKDFELAKYQKGNKEFFVAKNSLAITKKWLNENGDRIEHTDWIPITLFGKNAENAEKFFKKGSHFLCEGKITTSSYVDETTKQTKYGWGVEVSKFHFTKAQEKDNTSTNTQSANANLPEPPQELESSNVVTDKNIQNAPETSVEFDIDNAELPFG